MEFSFNLYNTMAADGEVIALKRIMPQNSLTPVILCVGSDLSVGDSLGPLVGTMLKNKLRALNIYVYGTLARPITAHEVKYMNEFIRQTHPNCPIIAVDAAVGTAGDIGLIKIIKRGLKPGSGANKNLTRVGDVSVMGIVAEKTMFNYTLFSSTRLNMVFRMAQIISDGIAAYLTDFIQTKGAIEEQRAENIKIVK
ncbi:MAG: spore protease YyaC [Candidatus Coproplasma sp.]